MIYVRAELASDAIRWAIRLSQTTPTFCSLCVGYSLQNMERGLNVWRDVPPRQWDFVNIWKLRQGKTFKTPLGAPTIQRAMALQQGHYRQAKQKLKEFERAFQAGEANLKVVFQVQEGPEGSERVERWPEKLRRMARYFRVKPNELANRMIAAGILALEREDPDYEPDFVIDYRQKVVIPRIEQYQGEKKLAEAFNPYSDVPKELESDGWAFRSHRSNQSPPPRAGARPSRGQICAGDILQHLARYDTEPCLPRQAHEHLYQPHPSGLDRISPTA
jgi:hypothetical protein